MYKLARQLRLRFYDKECRRGGVGDDKVTVKNGDNHQISM